MILKTEAMNSTETKASGACPTFFRASCRKASEGGKNGYEWAAYNLIGAVGALMREDHGDELAQAKLKVLANAIWQADNGLLIPPDDEAVLAWFDREIPRCMALIPARRRYAFLKGVYRWTREEGNDITVF